VNLGRVGAWTNAPLLLPPREARALVEEIDSLGYPALWFPEGAGEAFSNAALMLAWSERLVVATGIANIWARDPTAMARGAKILGAAYPARFLLGIGVSHAPTIARRGHEYGKPVATMQAYLDAMERAEYQGAEPEEPVPVVLAALGPRMLELASARTEGAHPYFSPVEHTAFARERLGDGKLLAVELAVVLAADESEAHAAADPYLAYYLALDNYRRNLARFGIDEANAFDKLVAWGDEEAVAARVREHLDAGADHVCVQPLPAQYAGRQLRDLAPALHEL
jgi:probable F420-dependent oxidoreductase